MTEEVKVEKKQEDDWMTRKWRPLMAIMYMTCCLADFFLFPIMFTVVQFWETQAANDAFRQWVPITLQGGGLFHVAMGAVLGVSAYGRTQEKLGGVASTPQPGGVPTPTLSSATPAIPQTAPMTPAPVAFTPAAAPIYNEQPVAQVVTGFGGKPAPAPAPQPLL